MCKYTPSRWIIEFKIFLTFKKYFLCKVRIEGKVQKVPKDESVAYFHSRPRDSQIGACASEQSTVIAGRHVLINKEQELKEKYKDDQPIECPYWYFFTD